MPYYNTMPAIWEKDAQIVVCRRLDLFRPQAPSEPLREPRNVGT
ncbi:hypothetical protein CfE428DRAFT_5235 [Chthoniobacter flavus Ellin428]|uniref:Uncharacterized protein n=1 Tax=Chthoniobacter flavus Ellin428 TaxID=497964 RepID=B4D8J5_9BACT|nr:hypothetical protein CfE428DRAFT_5235 [Chthoniobacter flavus Ellin428]TCO86957.1 hypothetical protein EV701_12552 [Chthoniobacter flavus]